MGVIMQLCKKGKKKTRNTGADEQKLEGVLERPAVAKKGFRFASLEDFKSKEIWDAAIMNKDIVPLFDAFEVAPENTEATKFESGKFSYETSPAVKKTGFECYLSLCSHRALKSYNNSEYTQVFEFTADGAVFGVDAGEGKIKGQDLSNLNVGIRTIATKDKPANTKVVFTYRDYNEFEDNPVGVLPDFDVADLNGIFDVQIFQVSASATSIKFRVNAGCCDGEVPTLTNADIILKDAAGVVKTFSFVPYNAADDVYEITGTGFLNGYTLSLNGVLEKPEIMYEAEEALVIKIS